MMFQEYLYREPFWMLVACCLVNQTTWKQAKPVFEEIKKKWSTVEDVKRADPSALYPILRPLGLANVRSKRLPLLASAYLQDTPKTARDVHRLPGCGKYASDSWAIFIDGDLTVQPTDKELLSYLEKNNGNNSILQV